MRKKKTYTGINIQYPISQQILDGTKTIETRTYPIPKSYINQDLLLVETPGPMGRFKARAVAVITFSECYKYSSKKEFYQDKGSHKVTPDSPWAWQEDKGKWGWRIGKVVRLKKPVTLARRLGIRYTKDLVF